MGVIHVTRAWVLAGREAECIARLRDHLPELRAADGLHASFVGRSMDADERHRLSLVTVWRDVDALEQHNGGPGMLRAMGSLSDLLESVEVDLAESILESVEPGEGQS